MRYWDSSALVQLLVVQPASADVGAILDEDRSVVTSWLTRVECWSAVARLRRGGEITEAHEAAARERLATIYRGVTEVALTEPLRELAGRLLRAHDLRSGDALQLAAALTWASSELPGAQIVSLDRRLCRAATIEGLSVVP